MADKETEQEWARLRRIEAEKDKARKAIEEEDKKQWKVNAAFLDSMSGAKVRGFSRGSEALRQSSERLANWSTTLGVCGIIVDFLSRIVDVRGLGMAGAMMIGVINVIGFGMIGIAAFLAAFNIGAILFSHKKHGISIVNLPLRATAMVLGIIIIYELIWFFINTPR